MSNTTTLQPIPYFATAFKDMYMCTKNTFVFLRTFLAVNNLRYFKKRKILASAMAAVEYTKAAQTN